MASPGFYDGNGLYGDAAVLIANASNIRTGSNPAYVKSDFLAFYPQFTGNIDDAILDQFITMATNTVLQVRWHENWAMGMALFIAHFATLYLQTLGPPNPTAAQVITAAQTRGLLVSESAGDISYNQDFSLLLSDLEGWANWKSTAYGLQFATMARMLGKANSYIW